MNDKQLGFSLLETLVALAILAIILSISVPVSHALLGKLTEEKILAQFQYDVLFLQNQSMVTNDYLRIKLEKNSYTLIGDSIEPIERKLPNGWSIDQRTLQSISFNENGTIRYAGTIQISSPTNSYIIVFPIGKGRGYIEKQ
ncbi:competence type IV pilus minor pilin ComGD [Ornithinibacillus sp. JPR2-1]|uniref:competence type IV pilus minor pilin ComGD n=1 Tax=Ornithinibacillus sp. JPR2-1 TaxID=2094019 RepID=UPI0031CF3C54